MRQLREILIRNIHVKTSILMLGKRTSPVRRSGLTVVNANMSGACSGVFAHLGRGAR